MINSVQLEKEIQVAQKQDINKIYDLLRRTVVFIYEMPIDGQDTPNPLSFPRGTAFGLGFEIAGTREPANAKQGFNYLITNKHVLHNDYGVYFEKVLIRANHLNGQECLYIPMPLKFEGKGQNVFCHEDVQVDLAAIELPMKIPNFYPWALNHDMIIDEMDFKQKVRVGTHVCSTGYLSGYPGVEKNHPVMRFGRIALLSEEFWYKTKRQSVSIDVREQAYVVEIGSVGGASGSPVLLDVEHDREGQPLLLGVIKGSMDGQDREPQGLVAVEPPHRLLELSSELHKLTQSKTQYRIIGREGIER
jgi:hypothetical protein